MKTPKLKPSSSVTHQNLKSNDISQDRTKRPGPSVVPCGLKNGSQEFSTVEQHAVPEVHWECHVGIVERWRLLNSEDDRKEGEGDYRQGIKL